MTRQNFGMDLADEAGADADSQNNLVAPLLQRVAADVQHFVKSCGYTRMPTRGEMRDAGGSRSFDTCYLIAFVDCPSVCLLLCNSSHASRTSGP